MKLELTESASKKLMVVPVLIFIICAAFLVNNYLQYGSIVKKGIDLSGGMQVTVHYAKPVNAEDFSAYISKELGTNEIDISTTTDPATRKPKSVIVSIGGINSNEKAISAISNYLKIDLKPAEYSVTAIGPALAGTFWSQAKWAFLIAFIFMMAVVGIAYRNMAAAVAILVSTVYDLTAILGVMAFFGMNLTLATFAALLMVIGYGVDTNIVLTEKIVKETEGTVYERVSKAMRTGLTMSAATAATLLALFVFSGSPVLKQIAFALLVGALADIPNTWILNANLLIWWPKKKS